MLRKTIEATLLICIIFVVIFGAHSSSLFQNKAKQAYTKQPSISDGILLSKSSLILKNKFNQFFTREFTCGNFAGSVLISYKGHIIYENAFGYANRRNKTPITTETVFQIGSMSKQFTAVAILQLASKGLLTLNDEVTKFYPNFPYKGITIRMLLTHRSGLPNYIYQFENNTTINRNRLLTNQEMVELLSKKAEKPYARPNKFYQYSNTGYALLAAIVEKISGLRFDEYVKKNIFEPLNMSHSFFYTNLYNHRLDTVFHVATGYLSPTQEAGFYYLNGILGDKGLFSTVEDLHKWDTSLYKGIILPKNWIDSAFTPQTKTRLSNIFYGFGWKLYFLKDSFPVQFHSGWWQGYQSIIMRLPKDSISIIVLKNKKTTHPINQRAMIDIFYPGNTFCNKTGKKNQENLSLDNE